MNWSLILTLFALCFTAVALGTWPLLVYLRRKNILDHPNERSSHKVATPRGGGVIMVPVLAMAWVFFDPLPSYHMLIVAGMALMLAVISWMDDLRGLSALLRLLAQFAVVATTLWLAPFEGMVFQGLVPPLVDYALTAFLWVWFINLFNFMDGIDGLSGVEMLIIGVGILALPNMPDLTPQAASLCGVAVGFLVWNWSPAKIFLGDVGSAALGYMLGWLLLWLASSGLWAAALILPGYYLADATITLVKRAARGERIWHAHKEHFYQKPVQADLNEENPNPWSHALVASTISALGGILVVCAYISTSGFTITGLVIAGLSTVGVLIFFAKNASNP